jgi:hypothetical protein
MGFLCEQCQKYFDLRWLCIRHKKRFCPTCYLEEYGWEGTEEEGFEEGQS